MNLTNKEKEQIRLELAKRQGWTECSLDGFPHGINPDRKLGKLPDPFVRPADTLRLLLWALPQLDQLILFQGYDEGDPYLQSTCYDVRTALSLGHVSEYILENDPDNLKALQSVITLSVWKALCQKGDEA